MNFNEILGREAFRSVTVFVGALGLLGCACASEPLPAFETQAGDFREGAPMWHIQGMAIGDDGMAYLCEGKALFKFELATGRRVKAVKVPLHSGDICYGDGRIYNGVAYGVQAGQTSPTQHGRIQVFDRDLNLVAEEKYPMLFDGLTALDGVLYAGVATMKRDHHRGCRIARIDQKTLKLIDVVDIDPGFEMEYGVQDLATDGRHILMSFYQWGTRTAMAAYTKDLKLVRTYDEWMSCGLDFLPSKYDRPEGRVLAKLECFRADPKAPATRPHGLDIRARFRYYLWNGEKLTLAPLERK